MVSWRQIALSRFERAIFGRIRIQRDLAPGPAAGSYRIDTQVCARPDGVVLHGWSARPLVAPSPLRVLLYFGGRNEDVCWAVKMASWLGGWTIYAFNYRGMGASGGQPSEAAVKADAQALLEWVRQQHPQGMAELAVAGRSLGTAVAIWLAHRVQPDTLVLFSPFCSLRSILQSRWRTLPLVLLGWWQFRCIALAPAIKARTLVLLAERDNRVALHDSLRLARALGQAPTIATVAQTTHQSLPRHIATQKQLSEFLCRPGESANGTRQ